MTKFLTNHSITITVIFIFSTLWHVVHSCPSQTQTVKAERQIEIDQLSVPRLNAESGPWRIYNFESQTLRTKKFLIPKVTCIVKKCILEVGMLLFAIINSIIERKGKDFFFFPVEAGKRRERKKQESEFSLVNPLPAQPNREGGQCEENIQINLGGNQESVRGNNTEKSLVSR